MKKLSVLLFTVLIVSLSSMAQDHGQLLTNESGVFLEGYDLVSYFEKDEPVKGSSQYKTTYHRATFYFASAENLEQFENNPEKYLPKYGGYCAFAMGKMGKKVGSDPNTYEVVDGNLYLFFNGEMKGKKMNTKIPWDKNQQQLQPMADENWEEIQN